MAIHRGATFNLAHSLDQMMAFRPHNRFEDLRGVYLVGGGTHPGSGLPVIFEMRADHRAAAGGGSVVARNLGRTGQARPADARARDRGGTVSSAVLDTLTARARRRRGGRGCRSASSAADSAALPPPARSPRAGHKVMLFEKNDWLGGKAAVLHEGGFRFDMGPTILTIPRGARAHLRRSRASDGGRARSAPARSAMALLLRRRLGAGPARGRATATRDTIATFSPGNAERVIATSSSCANGCTTSRSGSSSGSRSRTCATRSTSASRCDLATL